MPLFKTPPCTADEKHASLPRLRWSIHISSTVRFSKRNAWFDVAQEACSSSGN